MFFALFCVHRFDYTFPFSFSSSMVNAGRICVYAAAAATLQRHQSPQTDPVEVDYDMLQAK